MAVFAKVGPGPIVYVGEDYICRHTDQSNPGLLIVKIRTVSLRLGNFLKQTAKGKFHVNPPVPGWMSLIGHERGIIEVCVNWLGHTNVEKINWFNSCLMCGQI